MSRPFATSEGAIVSFDRRKVTLLAPVGAYNIELYDYVLRLRGRTYEHKIRYEHISSIFFLPMPDDVHTAFVIGLDKPILQGRERHFFVVLQMTNDSDEVAVNMEEDELEERYGGALHPVMGGPLANLFALSFKNIAKKKVFIPGKFAENNQQACVKCTVRGNEGLLYPIEKMFVFIHEPTILLLFKEIESVELQRYAGREGSTPNFDLHVNLKDSSAAAADLSSHDYTFSGIDGSDYQRLYNFLSRKKFVTKTGLDDETRRKEPGEDEEGEPADERHDDDVDEPGEEGDESGKPGEEDDAEPVEEYDDEPEEEEDDEPEEKEEVSVYKLYDDDVSDSSSSSWGGSSGSGSGDDSEDVDELGSEVDEDLDSDLEDARKLARRKKGEGSDDEDSDGGEGSPAVKKSKAKKAKAKKSKAKKATAKKSKASTSKAKNDPNAPKKPTGAYLFFFKAERERVKNKNRGASVSEIAKLMGAEWKELSPEEKSKYEKMAKDDMERYAREMKEYEPPMGPAGPGKGSKKTAMDRNAPDRPLTTALLFAKDALPKLKERHPHLGFDDLGQMLGEMLEKLSPREKAKYENLSEIALARFTKNRAAGKANQDGGSDESDADNDDDDDDSDGSN